MRLMYLTGGVMAGLLLAAGVVGVSSFLWLALLTISIMLLYFGGRSWLPLGLFMLGVALAGYRWLAVPQTADIQRYLGRGTQIEGVISDEPKLTDTSVQFRLETQTIFVESQTLPTNGAVLVKSPRTSLVQYGDHVRVTGLLVTPAQIDTFNYADYLARTGLYGLLQNSIVEVIDRQPPAPLMAALLSFKQGTQARLSQSLPEPAAGLLNGILTGSEQNISPDLANAFARTGAAHIIAISGFNMALLSGLIMRLFPPIVGKRVAALLGILILLVYTLFVGAGTGVIRAALMCSLLIVAPLLKRETFVPASLCGAALLMLLLNPFILWDISFQLSFGAVMGLALFGTPFAHGWRGLLERLLPPSLARIADSFTGEAIPVSLAAQIFTLPLIVLYFQRFSLVALIVNLLVLPFQPMIIYLGLSAALLLWVIPSLAQALLWFVFVLLMLTIGVVRGGARLPFADVPLYIDPLLLVLGVGLIGGGAMVQAVRPDVMKRLTTFVRSRPVWMTAVTGGLCVALLLFAIGLSRADGRLHVWFLAQGHSPAVLIQTPNGAKILVDGGRYPSRLLTALGDHLPFYDRHIDMLIMTQPDPFDIGALPAVLERYSVGTAISNGQPQQDEAVQAFIAALGETPRVDAKAGYQMATSDGVTIAILNPTQRPALGDSLDENGLILRVTYGHISFLLTGDASPDTLMQVGATYDLTSTVLSLPQHGAARSLTPDLLALVQPSLAVLQSDPANLRGDPNESILRLVEERGIPLLRTDLRGTMHLYSDGDHLWSLEE